MAPGAASRAASLPELCFTGARALARMLRARKVSATELMQAFIAQTERVNRLQRAVELADLRYRSGYSPYLEVLDAQRQLLQAQTLQINAARERRRKSSRRSMSPIPPCEPLRTFRWSD